MLKNALNQHRHILAEPAVIPWLPECMHEFPLRRETGHGWDQDADKICEHFGGGHVGEQT